MATIKDVAKETGLAVGTVSRVLNGRGYISEDTKAKVEEAMKKLNYHPNDVASSLSKQSSNTIGLIVPHIRHPYFAEIISAIENQSYKNQYKVLIFNTQEKDDRQWEYLEMCSRNRVAGVILCSGNVDSLKFEGLNVPLISVECEVKNGTASINCDNLNGGKIAANHLIDKGCNHLIHISGIKDTSMPADLRATGFSQICQENNKDYKIVSSSSKEYDTMDYHSHIKQILEQNPLTDGIFASSDLIALQVIQVCNNLGKRVPQDIKVIGFDDTYIARLVTPELTTIHQPIDLIAQKAVELLIKAVNNQEVPTKTILDVELRERKTT